MNYLARQGHFRKDQKEQESNMDDAVVPKTEARGNSRDGFKSRQINDDR